MYVRSLLASVAVLSVVACGGKPQIASARGEDRRECPHDWNFDSLSVHEPTQIRTAEGVIQLPPRVLVTQGGQSNLVGEIQNITEFHDCQRFIVVDSATRDLKYDSLFAIFASFRLDSIENDLAALEEESEGDLAGIAAALIYAEGEYTPLGIEDMFNCLFVYRDQGEWLAMMVPVGGEEVRCTRPINLQGSGGTRLSVHRPPGQTFADSAYPPVARWDWDPESQEQYVGIKCGRAWCEIGSANMSPTESRIDLSNSTMSNERRRVYEIKGWYDEQYLATYASGTPVPTSIKGTIIPHPDLGRYVSADFESTWLPVAEVELSEASMTQAFFEQNYEYKQNFNFDLTHAGGQRNQIEMCKGDQVTCEVDAANTVTACDERVSFSGYSVDTDEWWVRITGLDSQGAPTLKYKCVTRYLFSGSEMPEHVPGTVRWRWLVNDEGGWLRCAHGCCELL